MSTPWPSVLEKVRAMARTSGARTAITFEDEPLSYSQLNERSSQVANGLLAAGVPAQARVALIDFNHPSFLEVLLGALKARCALTPINARLAPPEIAWILNDSHAPILFVGRDHYACIESIEASLEHVKTIVALHGGHSRWIDYRRWRDAQDGKDDVVAYPSEDDIVQLYTSGTTGHPKGVCHTHRTWGESGVALMAANNTMFDPTCINLVCLPLFHVAGFNPACFALASGAQVVLARRAEPAEIVALARKYAITNTLLVPSLILAIVNLEPRPGPLPSLRALGYGAAPIAQELL